jgi:hypothetical protein
MRTNAMQQPDKPLKRFQWWACFLLATYLMSLWFQTFKTFTLVPSLGNGLIWLGVMTLLTLIVMVLTYDSYVQEKNRDRVQKPIRVFEWLMAKRFLLKGDLK